MRRGDATSTTTTAMGGGGIGAIQHELLGAGVAQAISVDASVPYLDAAREASRRRGHDGRVTFMHGDFVDLADSIAPAEARDPTSTDRAPPLQSN